MSSITVLYRPDTDHEPLIRDLAYNYKKQTGKDLKTLSLDTVEGSDMAKNYGIVKYPAIIAADVDGKMLQIWEGETFPLVNEISYYDQDK